MRMNYEARALHPLYQRLSEQKPLPNGTKELLFATVTFDMKKATGKVQFKSRGTNMDYLKRELDWYNSMSLEPPKGVAIWQRVKSKHGKVNSNYGYLVFSKKNGSQFERAAEALRQDPYTRQAMLIYMRPSMHADCHEDGMHDFVCTVYQQFFIREGKLNCVTNMRSNDCVFGTMNDVPWFEHVYNLMYESLKSGVYPKLKKGWMAFAANSFHCYERHYEVLQKIAEEKV